MGEQIREDGKKPSMERPRRAPQPSASSHNALAAGLIIIGTLGGGFFVLAKAGMRSTAGARVSTRLQWEQRALELDQLIADAEKEGKLRKPGTASDGH